MQRTDYKKVRQLAKDILDEYKKMIMVSDDLRQKLEALEGSFLDDAIDQINYFVNKLLAGLADAQDSIASVAVELIEYARLLEAGKGKNGKNAERAPASLNPSAMQTLPDDSVRSDFLVPNLSTPRDLFGTQFGMVKDSDGNLVYDSPIEMDQYLYKEQGSAYPTFQGTCGLCSCANILRLAGVNATEAQMITYASTTDNPIAFPQKLCTTEYFDPGMNGGTNPKSRQQILQHFGIDSGILPLVREKNGDISASNISTISDYISAGRGVILSVHADILCHDAPVGIDDYHAVTVTSVKKDNSGNVLGFYICDSANGGTSYYPSDKVRRSLTGAPMNVTHSIIR